MAKGKNPCQDPSPPRPPTFQNAKAQGLSLATIKSVSEHVQGLIPHRYSQPGSTLPDVLGQSKGASTCAELKVSLDTERKIAQITPPPAETDTFEEAPSFLWNGNKPSLLPSGLSISRSTMLMIPGCKDNTHTLNVFFVSKNILTLSNKMFANKGLHPNSPQGPFCYYPGLPQPPQLKFPSAQHPSWCLSFKTVCFSLGPGANFLICGNPA